MLRNLRAQSDFKSTILRNQLTSLVLYEVIQTTQANGRALETYANRFFNNVKTADLNSKKLAHAILFDKNAIKKVFEEILPRFKSDETTFVKLVKATPRKGDSASMAFVSLLKTIVDSPVKEAVLTEKKDKVTVTTRTKKKTVEKKPEADTEEDDD